MLVFVHVCMCVYESGIDHLFFDFQVSVLLV